MSKLLDYVAEIKEKYDGKIVSTDEWATISYGLNQAVKQLESISLKTGDDYILLKWGSLKGWDLHSEKGKKLSDEYVSLGRSLSAMSQKDDPRQKEIILEMIDECNGSIQNDWDGEYYTKKKAKEYITGYAA